LYVGNLGHTNLMSVADLFYYMALGHLHIKQKVGGQENIRYCGSPRPVGFGESGQKKIMIQLDLRGNIKEIEVPVFQHIASIKGDYSSIQAKLEKLKKEKQSCWVSIEYTGEEYIQNLPEKLEEIIQNSDVEILKIKNSRAYKEYLINKQKTVSLDQLTVTDVFNQILEENNLPEKEKEELLQTFKTTLDSIEREGKE